MNLRKFAPLAAAGFFAACTSTGNDATSEAPAPGSQTPVAAPGDSSGIVPATDLGETPVRPADVDGYQRTGGDYARAATQWLDGMRGEHPDMSAMPQLPAAPEAVRFEHGDIRMYLPNRIADRQDPAQVGTAQHHVAFNVVGVRYAQGDRVLNSLSDLSAATRRDEISRHVYAPVAENMELQYRRQEHALAQELVLTAPPAAAVGAQGDDTLWLEVVEEIQIDPSLGVLAGTVHRPLPAQFETEMPIILAARQDNAWAPVMNISYPDVFDGSRRVAGDAADAHYVADIGADGRGTLITRVKASYLTAASTEYPVVIDPHLAVGSPRPRLWAANVAPIVPGSLTAVVMAVYGNVLNFGQNFTVSWDDGTETYVESDDAQFLTHTYAQRGIYNIGLRVCDELGQCDPEDGTFIVFRTRIGTGAQDCSNLDGVCVVGVFDDATNDCIQVPQPNGTSCEDGLECTEGDSCDSGICVPGGAPDCSAFDGECTVGQCFEGVGCEPVPANEGAACDDGNLCTEPGSCDTGVCLQGADKDCSGESDDCNDGVCNPMTGDCEGAPANEGGACDDGDLCTGDGVCDAGTCDAGAPTVCADDGNPCTVDECNPANGNCESNPGNEGADCNDSNNCTVDDICDDQGGCAGVAKDCSAEDGQCTLGECNPADGGCLSLPANEGQPCDDGLFCFDDEVCVSGSCENSGTVIDCSALDDQCNDGVCNEAADSCVKDPSLRIGNGCDDGAFCNVGETCDPLGNCSGGAARQCPEVAAPHNQCNAPSCDEGADSCGQTQVADGTGCDDNNPATESDQCTNGLCAGSPIGCNVDADCNDNINCTVDTCLGDGSCDNAPVVCDASDFCAPEACNEANGNCEVVPVVCNDPDEDDCMVARCDQSDGSCEMVPAPMASDCNDGQTCTENDACDAAGACIGAATDCSALDGPCVEGECDPADGNCVAEPVAPDTACDSDGDGCTLELCDGDGDCLFDAPVNCGPSDFCNDFVCNSTGAFTHECEAQPRVGQPCEDGSFCTVNDECNVDGECEGEVNTCDDNIDCTDDLCNPFLNGGIGACQNDAIPSRCPGDDGVFCNGVQTCDEAQGCIESGDPCAGLGQTCNELLNECEGGGAARCEILFDVDNDFDFISDECTDPNPADPTATPPCGVSTSNSFNPFGRACFANVGFFAPASCASTGTGAYQIGPGAVVTATLAVPAATVSLTVGLNGVASTTVTFEGSLGSTETFTVAEPNCQIPGPIVHTFPGGETIVGFEIQGGVGAGDAWLDSIILNP